MPMKKIRYTISIALAVLCLTSCLKDQEDYFEQSASQRLQTTISRVRQLLCSSPYGWELEYYPHSQLAYGGIVYTIRFDSLQATVGCSLIPDSTATTYYRIVGDNGPVLTFDTYNPLIHYFSTPSATEYQGKGGEFELVIGEMTDDMITLYGKKTRNTMYLRRLTASPDEYARQTIDIYDHFVHTLTGNVGTAELQAAVHPTEKSIEIVSGRDTLTAHYTYNNRGIRLYSPLLLGGKRVQTFAFDKETNILSCLDEGATDVSLQGHPYPEDFMHFSEYSGRYTLRYNDNQSTATVTLTPNRLAGTYILSGLSSAWSLTLNYDDTTGDLTLGPQIIGENAGRTAYFVTYNNSSSSIWLTPDASFSIVWNKQQLYSALNIRPTRPETYNCNSALIIVLTVDDEGNAAASLVDDNSWMVGGSAALLNLNSLFKLRN